VATKYGSTAKLSKRTVDALAPRDKAFIAFDDDVKGFGVRVMPSGSKTYVLEYRPGAGGRGVAKRRLTLGRCGSMTVEQARKAALDALAHIRLGSDPHAAKMGQRTALAVSDLIDAFVVGHVGTKLKSGTGVGYKIALVKVRAVCGSTKAEALSRAQVAALHRSMAATPYQANRTLAAISSLYSWGERHGYLPEGHGNPARKIGRYREQGRERFLTSDEMVRLGAVLVEGETIGLPYEVDDTKPTAKHAPKADKRRVKLDLFAIAAIRLLILTGARLREILHSKWEHVDFECGMIFLPDSKTGRKPVYLSAASLAILASLPRIEDNPFVIPGTKPGQPRADLKKPWAAVTKAAGLEGLRLHDLRHSFASVGAGASLGLPVIGKLLGHTQPATTARYAHLDADPMRRAVETIGITISAALNRKPSAEVIAIKNIKS
jgi:integrase